MNALVNGNFFDGSSESIIIWLLLGILFGLPLYFFGQNKSNKTDEKDDTPSRKRSRKHEIFHEVSQNINGRNESPETIIECPNLDCKALNPPGSKTCWDCDASLELVITGNQLNSSLKELNSEKESTLRMLDEIDKSLVQGNVSESMYKDLKAKYELRIEQMEKEILETKKNLEALEKERLEKEKANVEKEKKVS